MQSHFRNLFFLLCLFIFIPSVLAQNLGVSPNISPDDDLDGLSNVDEITIYGTDPQKADTDGDSLVDGVEIRVYNTDPKVADLIDAEVDPIPTPTIISPQGIDTSTPTATISGQITDEATALPLSGIFVKLTYGFIDSLPFEEQFAYSHPDVIVETDANGEYSFSVSGPYKFYIEAYGYDDNGVYYELKTYETMRLSQGFEDFGIKITANNQQITGIDMTLKEHEYGIISGYVYDAETGYPLQNIGIRSVRTDGTNDGTAETDINGYYAIQWLRPGIERSVEAIFTMTYQGQLWSGGNILLTNIQPHIDNVNFNLSKKGPTGIVSGRVTDAVSGKPVESMGVHLIEPFQYYGFGVYLVSAVTDSNGNYSMSVPIGRSVYAVVNGAVWTNGLPYDFDPVYFSEWWPEAPRRADATLLEVTSTTPNLTNINFTINLADETAREGTVIGQLTNSITSEPITDASVMVWYDDGVTSYHTVMSDIDKFGNYEITNVWLNRPFRIMISTDSHQYVISNVMEVTTAQPDLTNIDFDLVPLGPQTPEDPRYIGTVSGQVINQSTGQPLSSVYIDAFYLSNEYIGDFRSVITDVNGYYTFPDIMNDRDFIISASLQTCTLQSDSVTNWISDTVHYEWWQETQLQSSAVPLYIPQNAPAVTGVNFTLEGLPSSIAQYGSISGRVIDWETELPLSGFTVYAGTASAVTNANGEFTISNLPTCVSYEILIVPSSEALKSGYAETTGYQSVVLSTDDPNATDLIYTVAPDVFNPPVGLTVTTSLTDTTPTFSWIHWKEESYESYWYEVVVLDANDIVVMDEWYPASEVCAGSNCTVTSDASLDVGGYSWWVRFQLDVSPYWYEWSDEAIFTIEAPSLARYSPTNAARIDTVGNWFKLQWQPLEGIEWYHVWVGDYGDYAFDQWVAAVDVCDGSLCTLPDDLWLTNGAYHWWMSYWGPNYQDYLHYYQETVFDIDVAVPGTIIQDEVSFEAAGVTGTMQDSSVAILSWQPDANALWYHVYVAGTDGYVVDEWHDARETCSESECRLQIPTGNAGEYTWWIGAWGPGGSSNYSMSNFSR